VPQNRVDSAPCRRTPYRRAGRPGPRAPRAALRAATDCRALVPQLEATATDPESVSAEAERLLYFALVGAIEVGLVRTAADALTVLRQASQPLGPMGAEWLAQQERRLDQA
jgi:hypothetical protein